MSEPKRVFTGYTDKNGARIFVGDRIFNPFVSDIWNVIENDGRFEAWLIPNSGWIRHDNPIYPMAIEPIADIADCFEIVADYAPLEGTADV